MSKKDAEKIVTQVFKVIEEALAANEKVKLVGFGTFEVKDRAEPYRKKSTNQRKHHNSGLEKSWF